MNKNDFNMDKEIKSITTNVIGIMLFSTMVLPVLITRLLPLLAQHSTTTQGIADQVSLTAIHAESSYDFTRAGDNAPWSTLSILNNGPASVFIALNDDVDFIEIQPDDTLEIDLTNSASKASIIRYKSNINNTIAVIVIDGKY